MVLNLILRINVVFLYNNDVFMDPVIIRIVCIYLNLKCPGSI